jgi:hypothetical protein
MRMLIIAAMLFVPAPVCALEIGARLPVQYGEEIVVRNDGGIRNLNTYFPYGSTCQSKWRLPMWLIVTRIVSDRTLLTLDLGIIGRAQQSCPHGTETSMPYAQARKRYENYLRALDNEIFRSQKRE